MVKKSICVSSSFTAEPLESGLKKISLRYGIETSLTFTTANRIVEEIVNPESLFNSKYDFNVILFRMEDILNGGNHRADDLSMISDYCHNLADALEILGGKNIIFAVLPVSPSHSLSTSLEKLQLEFANNIRKLSQVHVVDFLDNPLGFRSDEIYDDVSYEEGLIPYTEEFYNYISINVFRKIHGLLQNPFKLIILDCDNTLWDGTCGEGDAQVIVGEYFLFLQAFMLQKSKEGFLLALVSKNNEVDVWNVFENNKNMLLSKTDFIAAKINWEAKSKNIIQLSHELGIALEHMIFIDDDLRECHEVMEMCPHVFTLPLPKEQASIPLFLNLNWGFDKLVLTSEDILRNSSYKIDKLRLDALNKADSLNNFLSSLDIKIAMKPASKADLVRISQLTYRTNQFNLSSIRRTVDEIEELMGAASFKCMRIEVKDKFGYYGISGAIIFEIKEDNMLIDTLLLSCRVLGRGVEHAVVLGLKRFCTSENIKYIYATLSYSQKNKPIKDFFENNFKIQDRTERTCTFSKLVSEIPDDLIVGTLLYNESFAEQPTQKNNKESIIPTAITHMPNVPEFVSRPVLRLKPQEYRQSIHEKYYQALAYHNLHQISKFYSNRPQDESFDSVQDEMISELTKVLLDYPEISQARVSLENDHTLKVRYVANKNNVSFQLRKFIADRMPHIGKVLKLIPVSSLELSHDPIADLKVRHIVNNDGLDGTFEFKIGEIWKEVLNLSEVKSSDIFFDIGGTSFQAIRAIAKIDAMYGIRPDFKDFFGHTLKQFCFKIKS